MNTGENAAILETPRRSTRKSIRPLQDYTEIVEKKALRSLKKKFVAEDISEEEPQPQPRWTPAEVGKSSQKRGKRKTVAAQKRRKIELGENNSVDDKEHENEGLTPLETEQEEVAPMLEEMQEVIDTATQSDEKQMPIDDMAVLISNQKTRSENTELNSATEQEDQNVPLIAVLDEDQRKSAADLVPIGSVNDEHIVYTADTEQQEQNVPTLGVLVDNEEQPKSAAEIPMIDPPEEEMPPIVFPEENEPEMAKNPLNETFDKSGCVEIISTDISEKSEEPSHDKEEPNATFANSLKETLNDSDCIEVIPSAEQTSHINNPIAPLGVPKIAVEIPMGEVDPPEEEMPSLVFEEEDEPELATNPLNETFNKSDCVEIISTDISEKSVEPSHVLGDKEEPNVRNSLKEILNDSDCIEVSPPVEQTSHINNPVGLSAFKKTLKPGIKVTMAASPITTPQNRRKIIRVATPYGRKENNQKNQDEDMELVRSARKRSKSLCDEVGSDRSPRKVKFHSPSNTTVVIEDFDRCAQNVARAAKEKNRNYDNVTKRRKRSISLDEARKPPRTQTPQKLVTRTKLPNFAAIHNKNFNQMESLEEHVMRKAERAKLLSNSAIKWSKANPVSSRLPIARRALKPALDETQLQAPDLRFDAKLKAQPKKLVTLPSKARPPMDNKPSSTTSGITPKKCNPKKIFTFSAVTQAPSENKTSTLNTTLAEKKVATKPPVLNRYTPKKTLNEKYLNSLRECKGPKPAFNLSTAVPTQPISSIFVPSTSTASANDAKTEDKLGARHQRHVDMFKSRGDKASRTAQISQAIRGVRSNRRFDLQMQHRRNLENQ